MANKGMITTSEHLEYSEYERLVNSLHEDREYIWEMYARLSLCTACRASDVLSRKWSDILNRDQIMVTEKKTGKPRNIIFNPSVKKKLNEMYILLGRPPIDSFVFGTSKSVEGFSVQYVNRKLKEFKLKYNLDIGNFSTHTFRKTFGRYVYESNNKSAESIILLNKILNHTSIAATKAYIGLTQEEINGVYNSIRF
ncbi:MAG: tyrosine-type recombinase/integrase [Dysgonamonadaceae bacterium]|jgi:integrase|nr:tyrosine-type recombinase/integrase [Dysgonamonadaceae bacterium]